MAHLHGRPWKPHQRAVADLIGERTPTGGYAYPVVCALFPRQTGKTTFAFDLAMGRCLEQRDYRAAYTAQTGHVTTERFGERMAELATTALGRRARIRRSQGTERIAFGNSYLKAFPPRDGSLRGSALDLVIVDEPQEIDADLGHQLDQTILPTFTTRPRRQLILIGTAGTDQSAYLARYLALARAGAPGVALAEFGAADDDDPTDPAVWARSHPGLAAGLTDTDALASALAVMGPASFAREYLCVWVAGGSRIIPAADWAAIRHRDATPRDGSLPVLGVDVAVDRSAAALVACWPAAGGGVPVLEVIEYAPGVSWAGPRIAELVAEHQIPVVAATAAGPALTVVADCERLGVDVTTLTDREYTAACADLFDRVGAGTVWHRGEPALDAAVAGAGRRIAGDGWAWSRRSSTADVAPLVAGSLALWADGARPPAAVRPIAYAG